MTSYTQCLLRRNGYYQVAWLPTKFAVLGATLRIRDDEWEDGWVVEGRWTTMPEEYVRGHERDYRQQRKASDIDLRELRSRNARQR
jgi:hypothetical protein